MRAPLLATAAKGRSTTTLHAIGKSKLPTLPKPSKAPLSFNPASRRPKQQQPVPQEGPTTSTSPLAYQLATGLHLAVGISSVFAPNQLWASLGATDVVFITETSTRVFGAFSLITVAATYWLSLAAAEGADGGDLDGPTNAKLHLYLGLATAGYALPLIKGAALGTLAPLPSLAAAAALILATSTSYIPGYLASGGSTSISQLISNYGQELKTSFRAGRLRDLAGLWYCLAFWEAFVLGLAFVGSPFLPNLEEQITGTTIVAKELVGIATLLFASCVLLLIDHLDRGKLDSPTARLLNVVCGAVGGLAGALSSLVELADVAVATNTINQTVVYVSGALSVVYLGLALRPPRGEA